MSERAVGQLCPGCGATIAPSERCCEECGREPIHRAALPDVTADPAPDRAEADLGAVRLITDRGMTHAHNEDAVAAAVVADAAGPAVVVVVSDGVSTSHDPQAASGAAARTGVDACLAALAGGSSVQEAVPAGLEAAFEAVRGVSVAAGHAPSCTYVSAVLRPCGNDEFEITLANVGDSRAYWLSAERGHGSPSQRLTVDDSFAQLLIAGGVDEQTAMRDPRAHALMRWLGADSGHVPGDTAVSSLRVRGPGALLLCSDGLWNYLPDPDGLAAIATADEPGRAARDLVDFALHSGGSDNITVALVPAIASSAS
ncbi:PP2C family serine/threonine-protein phosphatase [Nocardia sp. BMG51109]|uniref:PP2C family protein-serine/threonine phosphatase n=1 Tax=Nocardia sp. BMG51109 TaxID=1056816 RepID=UPI0004663BA5|nr:protein phosphatase 2C domain-containing protein [Nocardia sp. BMG51109]